MSPSSRPHLGRGPLFAAHAAAPETWPYAHPEYRFSTSGVAERYWVVKQQGTHKRRNQSFPIAKKAQMRLPATGYPPIAGRKRRGSMSTFETRAHIVRMWRITHKRHKTPQEGFLLCLVVAETTFVVIGKALPARLGFPKAALMTALATLGSGKRQKSSGFWNPFPEGNWFATWSPSTLFVPTRLPGHYMSIDVTGSRPCLS